MPEFPYVTLPSEGREVSKPLIPVLISYPKTHKLTPTIYALIDSGADVCFCLSEIGQFLGIPLTKIKERKSFTTANGTTFTAQPVNVNLYVGVGGKSYLCSFFFTNSLPRETPNKKITLL